MSVCVGWGLCESELGFTCLRVRDGELGFGFLRVREPHYSSSKKSNLITSGESFCIFLIFGGACKFGELQGFWFWGFFVCLVLFFFIGILFK